VARNYRRKKNRLTSYTEASHLYRTLGWDVVVPARLAPESKKPDPSIHDVFGRNRKTGLDNTATSEQMDSWEIQFPERNCLLKMNKGFIGIDVDQYLKWSKKTNSWIRKNGYDNMMEDFVRYGDLSPTYTSTSRGPNQPSRIYLFGVDDGAEFNGSPYDDVEIIQLHHRYAVVWPSIHPETGEQYKWYDPDGVECAPPRPSDISKLPREWYPPLMTTKKTSKASRGCTGPNRYRAPYSGSAADWLNALDDGPMDFMMSLFLVDFSSRPTPHIGHDELLTLIGRLHHLQFVRGCTGAREVFESILQTYMDYTNEADPTRELFNIIRYVAGEDFQPCPTN
jgi:hypothetical protein